MPQIPTYGGPQVTPNVIPYRPFSTDVPKVPDSGVDKTIGRVAARIDKEAQRYMEEQDNARVTDALTALRRHAIDVQSGENGYQKLLGENALTPDEDGRGLVERVDADMHEFGSSLAAGLNARQQKLFHEKAQPIYTSSYGGVSAHVFDQGLAYEQNKAEAAIGQLIESGSAYAGRGEMLAANERDIGEQVDVLARLRGYSDDQRDLLRRKSISGMYVNAINTILSNAERNPAVAYGALGILRANSKKMLGSDVATARRSIDVYVEKAQQDATVRGFDQWASIKYSGQTDALLVADTGGVATPREQGGRLAEIYENGVIAVGGGTQENHETTGNASDWHYGISKLKVTEAEAVAKAHGIPFDKERFLKDRGYNFSLGQWRMSDLYAEYAGDEAKVFAAYRDGEAVVEEAMKKAAADGTPDAWFYSLPSSTQEYVLKCQTAMRKADDLKVKDENGEEMSSFRPGYFAKAYRGPTYDEAREYVMRTDPRASTDPDYRESTIQKIMGLQAQHKSSWVTEHERRVADLSDQIYASGGDLSRIPASTWAGLTRKEQQDVIDLAEKVRVGDDSTDPQMWARYYCDEDTLVNLSPEQLRAVRGSFSAKDYELLQRKYYQLKLKAGQAFDERTNELRTLQAGGVPSAYGDVSSADVNRALETYLPGYSDLKKSDPQGADVVLGVVMRQVAEAGAARGEQIKGSVNMLEALRDPLRQMVNVRGFAWGEEQKSIYSLSPGDLPDTGPTDAANLLKTIATKAVGREPTEGEEREVLLKLFTERNPRLDLSGLSFDSSLMGEIRQRAPNATLADQVRFYFIERLARTRVAGNSTGPRDRTAAVLTQGGAFEPYDAVQY